MQCFLIQIQSLVSFGYKGIQTIQNISMSFAYKWLFRIQSEAQYVTTNLELEFLLYVCHFMLNRINYTTLKMPFI